MRTASVDIASIKDAVARAASGTAIRRAYLFGSRARGEEKPGSDIDLCVEADRGFSLIDAGKFSDAVEAACGCAVDVISDRFLTPSTRARITADKVLLYER